VLDLGSHSPAEVQRVLASLRRDPSVRWAEEDKHVQPTHTFNDPSFWTTGSWGQPYDSETDSR
jgi:hypothetical protein